jgi:hypothetical protein
MDEQTARRIAESAREAHEVPPDQVGKWAERRIIEIPDDAARVRDARVWVVRFVRGPSWTELAVEEPTGDVVRVERSR